MGSSQRLGMVAAAAYARRNHTQPDVTPAHEPHGYGTNMVFVGMTLCCVLVAVCIGCRRRGALAHKPAYHCRGIYTVSTDERLPQMPDELTGPPPAYDSVIHGPVGPPLPIGALIGPPAPFGGPIIDPLTPKDCNLQEIVTEANNDRPDRCDNGLPSYEAAVLLRDTKL